MLRAWIVIAAVLPTSACATFLYERETRTIVAAERVTDTRTEREVVESPHLRVHDLRVEGTVVHGRLESARMCREEKIDQVVLTNHRETVWVDEEGEAVSMGSLGATQMGAGILMPLIVPIAIAVDSDDTTSDELVVGFYIGIGLGAVLLVSGLVDAFAALGAGVEEKWDASPIERRTVAPSNVPCEMAPSAAPLGTLFVGTATVGFRIDDGVFAAELEPIADHVLRHRGVRWAVETEAEGSTLIDIGDLARQGLYRSLEAVRVRGSD